ncbi:MAG: regulatory protein RecX [Fidelibacterota bacterium]
MTANLVKIIDIRRVRGKQYRIRFNNDSELQLTETMYFSAAWQVGDEIPVSDIRNIAATDQIQRAKEKAILLLSYRKRSKEELRQRLTREKYSADTIRTVINSLSEKGYLNDHDFAVSFARDKVRNTGAGPRKIAMELSRHHIDDAMIEDVIQAVYREFPIPELIQTLLRKRHCDLHTRQDQQRAIRYLQGKGFYTEHILKEIRL